MAEHLDAWLHLEVFVVQIHATHGWHFTLDALGRQLFHQLFDQFIYHPALIKSTGSEIRQKRPMREATTEEEFATFITIISGTASIVHDCIANAVRPL
ncbi:MAG: hypothetical protein NTW83_00625 [Cyanobacteria bacterium]|nr:hypothetical protein [Cyanobacteriota bacterium]